MPKDRFNSSSALCLRSLRRDSNSTACLDRPSPLRRPALAAATLLAALLLAITPTQATATPPDPVQHALRMHIALEDVAARRRPPLERMTRQALRDVERLLGAHLQGNLFVDYVGGDVAFKRVLDAHGGGHGSTEPWLDGLALLHADRIIVRMQSRGLLRTSEVVRHEIAHIAIHALSGRRHVPRWYHEGVAMLVAGEATYKRLMDASGASGHGLLDNLVHLDGGFAGNRVAVQQAYAVSAGFVRFAVARTGNARALADLHWRMSRGLDFSPAFTATFGLAPEPLFELYAHYVGTSSSRWTTLLTDSVLWSLLSVLFLFSMTVSWLRRPQGSDEPMDLAAIARAGEGAMHSGTLWIPQPEEPDDDEQTEPDETDPDRVVH